MLLWLFKVAASLGLPADSTQICLKRSSFLILADSPCWGLMGSQVPTCGLGHWQSFCQGRAEASRILFMPNSGMKLMTWRGNVRVCKMLAYFHSYFRALSAKCVPRMNNLVRLSSKKRRLVWFSDQIRLENGELNNIKQFLKVKKRSVEVIRAFIGLMNVVTI